MKHPLEKLHLTLEEISVTLEDSNSILDQALAAVESYGRHMQLFKSSLN